MAEKLYGFNEKERADYFGIGKITHGKGKQIHLRKKWDRRGKGGGGVSVTPVSIKVVLIDADIDGITESDPSQLLTDADIPLAEEEEEWTVIFQDPPDDDYDENNVDDLNLWSYERQRVPLKYFENSEGDVTGTAEDGGADTITLQESEVSETDDFYNGDTITITAGTGSGQSKTIEDYVGSTRVATVDSAWSTEPDIDSEYVIISDNNRSLAYTVIDDSENDRKIIRYATTSVWYDDGRPFLVGEYKRSDYPDYDENAEWPPDDLPEGFLNRRFRGIAINNVLVTALCQVLPPPELPE